MNQNAEKWVAALRSGEFAQTSGVLTDARNNQPQHCCLGVACELYRREVGDLKVKATTTDSGRVIVKYDGSASYLPIKVQEWLDLRSPSGAYVNGSLTSDNDKGTPFKGIADIIESEPADLFFP